MCLGTSAGYCPAIASPPSRAVPSGDGYTTVKLRLRLRLRLGLGFVVGLPGQLPALGYLVVEAISDILSTHRFQVL